MKKRCIFWVLGILLLITSCRPISSEKPLVVSATELAGAHRLAYAQLDQQMQENYDRLNQAVYSLESYVDTENLTDEQVTQLIEYYKSDNPQVFWLGSNYGYRYNALTHWIYGINLEYLQPDLKTAYTKEQIQQMNQQIENETQAILSGISPEMDDYQKVKYLHDTLTAQIVYREEAVHAHDLYGALVEKQAVCDGYTYAFQYLLNRANLKGQIVYGASEDGVAHAWNVVQMGEEYYHIDVTWDTPSDGVTRYAYFGMDDEMAQRTRVIYSPFLDSESSQFDYYPKIPHATGKKNNYFVREGKLIENYLETGRQQVIELATKTVQQHNAELQLQFVTQADYEQFVNDATNGSLLDFLAGLDHWENCRVSLSVFDEALSVALEFQYG